MANGTDLMGLAVKGLRRWWKTSLKRSTSGPGSEHDDGEELGDATAIEVFPSMFFH